MSRWSRDAQHRRLRPGHRAVAAAAVMIAGCTSDAPQLLLKVSAGQGVPGTVDALHLRISQSSLLTDKWLDGGVLPLTVGIVSDGATHGDVTLHVDGVVGTTVVGSGSASGMLEQMFPGPEVDVVLLRPDSGAGGGAGGGAAGGGGAMGGGTAMGGGAGGGSGTGGGPACIPGGTIAAGAGAPFDVCLPTILAPAIVNTGTAVVADDGQWDGGSSDITFLRTWLRCDADGGNCVPITTPGTLSVTTAQTDSTRAAGVEGDGLPVPSSSFGTWYSTLNLAPNGGFETDTGSWGGNGATLARDTLTAKFGQASLKVTTSGAAGNESASFKMNGKPNATYSVTAWVDLGSPLGTTLMCITDVETLTDGGMASHKANFNATSQVWTRAGLTFTAAPATAQITYGIGPCTGAPVSAIFNVDGVQVEEFPLATPYVEMNGGVRQTTVVTADAGSLLNPQQGWVAFRVTPEWTPDAGGPTPVVFTATGGAFDDGVRLSYDLAQRGYVFAQLDGGASVHAPSVATPGSGDTVIAEWGSDALHVSVNGGAVFSTPGAGPGPMQVLQLGSFDGEVHWAAFGEGLLNGADRTAFFNFMDNDPPLSQLGGNPTFRWSADTAAFEQTVTGTTYTPGPTDVGMTLRVRVTAINAFGITTAISPPTAPVTP